MGNFYNFLRGRSWYLRTEQHQTLTLDGKNSTFAPKNLGSEHSPRFTALQLENRSYPNLTHRRSFALLDGTYLLVFDEADKLTEPVFHYFISLYNKLEEKCGVVFLSTDYIAKRISNGLRYQKPGYKEFYSRIGRKFYELEPTDVNDVFAICSANGVTDRKDIDKVIKEASTCDFDLRRVRKSIHKVKRMTGE